jgi:hypothetical protein
MLDGVVKSELAAGHIISEPVEDGEHNAGRACRSQQQLVGSQRETPRVAVADRLRGGLHTRDGGSPPFQPFLHSTHTGLALSTSAHRLQAGGWSGMQARCNCNAVLHTSTAEHSPSLSELCPGVPSAQRAQRSSS